MKRKAEEAIDEYDYHEDLKKNNKVEVGERTENYPLRSMDCVILGDKSTLK